MQGPGIYVLQTMPGDHDVDSGSGRGFHSSAAQPASSAAQPGSSAAQLANYKVWCWAECQKVAMPCKRNREEMIAAFEDFKRRFFDLPEQKSKDPEKKTEPSQCAHGSCLWTLPRRLGLSAHRGLAIVAPSNGAAPLT